MFLLLVGVPLLIAALGTSKKDDMYSAMYRLEDPDRYTPGVPQFELGQIVMTNGVQDLIGGATAGFGDLRDIIRRHQEGDWGSMGAEDSAMNDEAVIAGDRIMGAHELGGEKIWVITEWDRSVTTALLPSEY